MAPDLGREKEPPVILELRDVVCRLGDASGFELAIEDFTVARGEAIAIAGPSGSGKSTALNLLALAQAPTSVERFWMTTREGDTFDIGALWRDGNDDRLTRIRGWHQGYVLQQGGLLPYLSVRDNIGLGLALHGRSDARRIADIAQRLEIAALLDRAPATLSVGQRQRVAIARALAHQPELLLTDEPTASVHPSLADAILGLLREQAWENDATLVLATHDPERAARNGFEIVDLAAIDATRGERTRLSRVRSAAEAAAP
jgi:putative ABC transport system ATP-binding protein